MFPPVLTHNRQSVRGSRVPHFVFLSDKENLHFSENCDLKAWKSMHFTAYQYKMLNSTVTYYRILVIHNFEKKNFFWVHKSVNPLNPALNPICYLLTLLAHNFLNVSRIRVKSLTLRLLMSYIYIYIYGAPILDVSRSHTTTHHSR